MADRYEKSENLETIPRVTLRLKVALPVLLMIFTFSAGYAATEAALKLLSCLDIPMLSSAVYKAELRAALWSLGIAGLAAFLGFLLAQYISKPIERLSLKAMEVAKADNYSLTLGSLDEIGLLSANLEAVFRLLDKHIRDSQILASLPAGILTLDEEDRIISVNEHAQQILHLERTRWKNIYIWELFAGSKDLRALMNLIKAARKGGQPSEFLELKSSDIEPHKRLEVTISKISSRPSEPDKPDLVLSIKDVSQVQHVRDYIRRADKLTVLGSLSAGVAHELRNPLASLQGMLELLAEELPEDEVCREYINKMSSIIDRMNRLVEELMDFSRDELTERTAFQLDEVTASAIMDIKAKYQDKKKIKLQVNMPEKPIIIEGDPSRFARALSNLLDNAYYAAPEGGLVRLSCAERTASDPPGKKTITIEIENEGEPIPEEIADRIFEPFYTTKKEGTGLGLAITHRVIGAHGGQIDVEKSELGGALFRISLPG